MKLTLDLQVASEMADLPDAQQLERWLSLTLHGYRDRAELSIRLVDPEESQELNQRYRGRARPTNVLSFPFDVPEGVEDDSLDELLGDLVICAPVVREEAAEQGKAESHHWAHMVVHGTLHLLGFDHIDPHDAELMETIERRVLAELGIPDPYLLPDDAPVAGLTDN